MLKCLMIVLVFWQTDEKTPLLWLCVSSVSWPCNTLTTTQDKLLSPGEQQLLLTKCKPEHFYTLPHTWNVDVQCYDLQGVSHKTLLLLRLIIIMIMNYRVSQKNSFTFEVYNYYNHDLQSVQKPTYSFLWYENWSRVDWRKFFLRTPCTRRRCVSSPAVFLSSEDLSGMSEMMMGMKSKLVQHLTEAGGDNQHW